MYLSNHLFLFEITYSCVYMHIQREIVQKIFHLNYEINPFLIRESNPSMIPVSGGSLMYYSHCKN